MRCGLLLLALCCCGLAAPAVGAEAVLPRMDEPRPYGIVIGDVLTRRAHITLPAGRRLDADALPRPGRVDNWLELRALKVDPTDAAPGAAVVLRLDYQVINVGPRVTTTVLPALRLPLSGGAAGETVELDDWPVHLSPLTSATAVARGGLDTLQPDIVPAPEPLAPIAARIAGCIALAALLAVPWLLRRYPQLAFWRRHAPFRRAWRELGALRRRPMDEALVREALRRLHAAFDAAAGRALFAGQIEPLYAARPALRAAAGEIDAFFAASQQRFFGQASDAAGPSIDALRALALRLARLEAT